MKSTLLHACVLSGLNKWPRKVTPHHQTRIQGFYYGFRTTGRYKYPSGKKHLISMVYTITHTSVTTLTHTHSPGYQTTQISICETTSAHKLLLMLVTYWLTSRQFFHIQMYWTPAKILLLADVDEYSFANAAEIIITLWGTNQLLRNSQVADPSTSQTTCLMHYTWNW